MMHRTTFPIGVYWPPSPAETNDQRYGELKELGINVLVGGNRVDTPEANRAALDLAEKYGLQLLAADRRFAFHHDHEALMRDVTEDYKGHPALMGYHLVDEPFALKLAHYHRLTELLKAYDPDSLVYVNLNPIWAPPEVLELDQYDATDLVPGARIGQTFRTTARQRRIGTVRFWIEWEAGADGAALTLTLWDSRSKRKKVAEQAIAAGSGTVFDLEADTEPNRSYYMELTASGGRGGAIGRLYRSRFGDNWLHGGTAVAGGEPIDADLWFVFDQEIEPLSYEDYVYRWVRTAPDVLSFDIYPFLEDGTIRGDYFANLEVIRRQALTAEIDFWNYIQAIGISGYLKDPAESEMRWQIYTSLAYGAKGYMYFTFMTPDSDREAFTNGLIRRDGSQNDSFAWAKQINDEIRHIGPVLLRLTSEAVYHTGDIPQGAAALPEDFVLRPVSREQPLVIGSFRGAEGKQYVMIVNRDIEAEVITRWKASGKPASVYEISKQTGEEVPAEYDSISGTLSATLMPGEGRLFVV